LAGVSGVSPDQLPAPKAVFKLLQHHPGPIPVLDVSGMDHHGHDQAHCVHHKMALAPADFLARIVAAGPPFSVVLTLWLSIIAALGVAWRPLSFRTCSRKASITRFETAQKLRGYSGLVPVVRQSGERRYTGPLKKRGNHRLRWALVMAAGHFAGSTKTRTLSLTGRYRHHVYKHGPNPAKVALARRLVDIIFAMLRDKTVFDSARYLIPDVA